MHSGIYKIAGIVVQICSEFPNVQKLCKDYQINDIGEVSVDFVIETSIEDIGKEHQIQEEMSKRHGDPYQRHSDGYVETLAVYRKLVEYALEKDTFLMHGSVVAIDDEAYMFTAKSGIGKTTHTKLWLENIEGAYVVNGDKPLLRIEDDKVIACGTPWQGKENYGRNIEVPLKAICILERSQDNWIKEIGVWEAMPSLMQQIYSPVEESKAKKSLELIEKLVERVKFYRLGCNMDKEAAVVAYNGVVHNLFMGSDPGKKL